MPTTLPRVGANLCDRGNRSPSGRVVTGVGERGGTTPRHGGKDGRAGIRTTGRRSAIRAESGDSGSCRPQAAASALIQRCSARTSSVSAAFIHRCGFCRNGCQQVCGVNAPDLWMIGTCLSKTVDKPVETVDNFVNKYDADHNPVEIREPGCLCRNQVRRGCRDRAVRDNAVRDNIETVTFPDVPAVAEVPTMPAAAVV